MTSRRHIYCALLFTLSLSLSALLSCSHKDENAPEEKIELIADSVSAATEQIVFETDSDEWHVRLFKEGVLYSELKQYVLPSPWRLPTQEEAKILRKQTYSTPAGERFFTDNGYTFQMPSASVTVAGSKKKYSIVGLWRRRTVFIVEF